MKGESCPPVSRLQGGKNSILGPGTSEHGTNESTMPKSGCPAKWPLVLLSSTEIDIILASLIVITVGTSNHEVLPLEPTSVNPSIVFCLSVKFIGTACVLSETDLKFVNS